MNDNCLLAGTETDGLFISKDAGRSWSSLTPDVNPKAINTILLYPNFHERPQILSLLPTGLNFSPDQGQTWEKISVDLKPEEHLVTAVAPLGFNHGAPLLIGTSAGRVI